jgi:hypothetical protein
VDRCGRRCHHRSRGVQPAGRSRRVAPHRPARTAHRGTRHARLGHCNVLVPGDDRARRLAPHRPPPATALPPLVLGPVFPLGMYGAATFKMRAAVQLEQLGWAPKVTLAVAIVAWVAAFRRPRRPGGESRFHAGRADPNQLVSARGSSGSSSSLRPATYPSGRISTAWGAGTSPMTAVPTTRRSEHPPGELGRTTREVETVGFAEVEQHGRASCSNA